VIEFAALALVAGAGLFLVGLGGAALLAPSRASGFLLAFAGSPAKHYAELTVRLVVGGAFVLAAPHAAFSAGFSLFGCVLLGTTAALLLVPWRWHRRFAQRAVPQALRFLPLVGAASLVLGALVLWAVWRGPAA